jgi:hypothetical protein
VINCPNCGEAVVQVSAPKRGPAMDSSEMWLCLKCPATVCIHCYHVHTDKEHPDMYQKRPTVGGQKNKKGKRR